MFNHKRSKTDAFLQSSLVVHAINATQNNEREDSVIDIGDHVTRLRNSFFRKEIETLDSTSVIFAISLAFSPYITCSPNLIPRGMGLFDLFACCGPRKRDHQDKASVCGCSFLRPHTSPIPNITKLKGNVYVVSRIS